MKKQENDLFQRLSFPRSEQDSRCCIFGILTLKIHLFFQLDPTNWSWFFQECDPDPKSWSWLDHLEMSLAEDFPPKMRWKPWKITIFHEKIQPGRGKNWDFSLDFAFPSCWGSENSLEFHLKRFFFLGSKHAGGVGIAFSRRLLFINSRKKIPKKSQNSPKFIPKLPIPQCSSAPIKPEPDFYGNILKKIHNFLKFPAFAAAFPWVFFPGSTSGWISTAWNSLLIFPAPKFHQFVQIPFLLFFFLSPPRCFLSQPWNSSLNSLFFPWNFSCFPPDFIIFLLISRDFLLVPHLWNFCFSFLSSSPHPKDFSPTDFPSFTWIWDGTIQKNILIYFFGKRGPQSFQGQKKNQEKSGFKGINSRNYQRGERWRCFQGIFGLKKWILEYLKLWGWWELPGALLFPKIRGIFLTLTRQIPKKRWNPRGFYGVLMPRPSLATQELR